jgi:hypothetical protein
MSSPLSKGYDPITQLQNEISDIRRIAEEANRQRFIIPVLEEDPPETDRTMNIWMFFDGRIRARHRDETDSAWVYREWVPTAPGSSSSGDTAPPAPPAVETFQTTWGATYTQSYRQSGAKRTDAGEVMLYYGSSGDSFNGMNQSLIGFDHSAIATALSGSTINAVWLDLTNIHAWYNSGSDIHFGIHNFSSEPTTWAGGGIPRRMIIKHHFGKPQHRTVSMPIEFAQAIRDGWGKGVALESPSTSREYYGYAAGVGSGHTPPSIIVNYTK